MKIIYRIGDLTEATEPVIAHGCNAQGVMGSGVAKAIREKFPHAYYHYRGIYEANDNQLHLGYNVWAPCGDKLIVNCITQDRYGRDGLRYVSYDAVCSCIQGINGEARMRRELHNKPYDQNPFDAFALPMIGAGLGGGNWSILEKIIEECTPDVQPVVYKWEG